jgi:hypothetical protein
MIIHEKYQIISYWHAASQRCTIRINQSNYPFAEADYLMIDVTRQSWQSPTAITLQSLSLRLHPSIYSFHSFHRSFARRCSMLTLSLTFTSSIIMTIIIRL